MYLPCLGSHLTIWLLLSKQEMVISETELDSWKAVYERDGPVCVGKADFTHPSQPR